MEGILRAVRRSGDNSNVIVLTDASCKDCEKRHEVVNRAKYMNIKIHFFFSGHGCDLNNFSHYKYVLQETGGINVSSIASFNSLARFITRQDSSPPKKGSVKVIYSSVEKCQTFNVSIFTVTFQLIVKQNNEDTKIYDPTGCIVKGQHINHGLSGYDSDEQPRNGSWTVCTVAENPIFTVTKKDLIDFAVDYYQDGNYSSTVPTAGTSMFIAPLFVGLLYYFYQ